jgi:hypothetical protein
MNVVVALDGNAPLRRGQFLSAKTSFRTLNALQVN